MQITTERLIIRELRPDDWKVMRKIWQDQSRSAYAQYDVPHSDDESEIKRLVGLFARSNDFYLVLLSGTDIVIGTIELHDTGSGHEIGYCFLSEYHRRGYAKEGCKALIDMYARGGVTRFTAGTALNNTPSVRLLNSLGFRCTGSERVSFYKDSDGNDIYFDGGIYELIVEQG